MSRNDHSNQLELSICPRSGVDSGQWDWGIRKLGQTLLGTPIPSSDSNILSNSLMSDTSHFQTSSPIIIHAPTPCAFTIPDTQVHTGDSIVIVEDRTVMQIDETTVTDAHINSMKSASIGAVDVRVTPKNIKPQKVVNHGKHNSKAKSKKKRESKKRRKSLGEISGSPDPVLDQSSMTSLPPQGLAYLTEGSMQCPADNEKMDLSTDTLDQMLSDDTEGMTLAQEVQVENLLTSSTAKQSDGMVTLLRESQMPEIPETQAEDSN